MPLFDGCLVSPIYKSVYVSLHRTAYNRLPFLCLVVQVEELLFLKRYPQASSASLRRLDTPKACGYPNWTFVKTATGSRMITNTACGREKNKCNNIVIPHMSGVSETLRGVFNKHIVQQHTKTNSSSEGVVGPPGFSWSQDVLSLSKWTGGSGKQARLCPK